MPRFLFPHSTKQKKVKSYQNWKLELTDLVELRLLLGVLGNGRDAVLQCCCFCCVVIVIVGGLPKQKQYYLDFPRGQHAVDHVGEQPNDGERTEHASGIILNNAYETILKIY